LKSYCVLGRRGRRWQ